MTDFAEVKISQFSPVPGKPVSVRINPKNFLHPRRSSLIVSPRHGGVAQLGERLTGSQEVRGSIPLVSTIVNAKAFGIPKAFFMPKYLAPQTPSTPTNSCTIYFPCLYIVCYPNAITSVARCSSWASGTLPIIANAPITCINVNNIPKQPP